MSHFRNKFAEMKDSEARFDGSGYISVDPTDFYTEGQTSSISLRKPSNRFIFCENENISLLHTFHSGKFLRDLRLYRGVGYSLT